MFKLLSMQVPIVDKFERSFVNSSGQNVPYYRLSTVDEKGYRFDIPVTSDAYPLIQVGATVSLLCDYSVYDGKGKLRVVGVQS